MRVGRFAITNVRSFRTHTAFSLREDLNVCIGPNGGGKSNTLEILSIVINHAIMTPYTLSSDDSGLKLRAGSGVEIAKELDKHIGDTSTSVIEIELVPGRGDVSNRQHIESNLATIAPLLARYDAPRLDAGAFRLFSEGQGLTYRLKNATLVVPPLGTAERSFLDYLRAFNALRFVAEEHPETGLDLSYPALLINSRRQIGGKLDIEVQNTGTNQHFQKLMQVSNNSSRRHSFSVAELALSYLGRIRRRAIRQSSRSPTETFGSVEAQDRTLQLLSHQLARIGWSYQLLSDDDLRYSLVLLRDGVEIPFMLLSSGEQELLGFLLIACTAVGSGGLVLVDEPELHLHPTWQRHLLSFMEVLSRENGNQFILATHSTVFVDPNTLRSVSRISKAEGSTSVAQIADADLPKMRTLVQVITADNNEKLFFADRIVFVEGITDKALFQSLLDSARSQLA